MILRRLLVALVLGCATLVAAPAGAWDADYGKVARDNGVLRGGCHDYSFRYRVRPGPHDWGAEFFLIGPGGENLASEVKVSDNHPKRGKGSVGVCKSVTRPGRFTIRGKLTITRGFDTEVHWIKPARFRLRRS